jgi:peptide/nickel transport system substrate-binding protein
VRNFALALLLAAPASAAVKNPETFTHLTVSDLETLDPVWAYDTASHDIIGTVYEYLLTYKGSTLELAPRLATKVPSHGNGLVSKDGLTYTFPIRKGVKFH